MSEQSPHPLELENEKLREKLEAYEAVDRDDRCTLTCSLLRTELAAAQAREVQLREALLLSREYMTNAANRLYDGTQGHGIRAEAMRRGALADAALATPPDHAALRAFGLKVAQRAHEQCDGLRARHENPTLTVDAVLKGDA